MRINLLMSLPLVRLQELRVTLQTYLLVSNLRVQLLKILLVTTLYLQHLIILKVFKVG